jgi:hypothetical protein
MEGFRIIGLIGSINNAFERLFEILSLINLEHSADDVRLDAILAFGGIDCRSHGTELNTLASFINDELRIPFYLLPEPGDDRRELARWFGVDLLRFMPEGRISRRLAVDRLERLEADVYHPALDLDGLRIGHSDEPIGRNETLYNCNLDAKGGMHLYVGRVHPKVDCGWMRLIVTSTDWPCEMYNSIAGGELLELRSLGSDFRSFFIYACHLRSCTLNLWRVYYVNQGPKPGWRSVKLKRPRENLMRTMLTCYAGVEPPSLGTFKAQRAQRAEHD